jgi:hypothetical protein
VPVKLTKVDNFKRVQDGLMRMVGNAVLVGIPEDGNARKPKPGEKAQPINNAALLFILTNGSPMHNIPATPVIEPAINAPDNKKRITGLLRQACEAELSGDHSLAQELMAKAGMAGSNAAKRWFRDPRNGWPPNADSTINRKLGKLSDKKREAAIDAIVAAKGDTTGIVTRNIDKGELRRAITYVVLDAQVPKDTDAAQLEGAGDAETVEAAETLALL